MGKGRHKGRRGALTPEQEAERFSTGGLGFEDSLERVPTGGPDDEGVTGMEAETERPLSKEEIEELLERERVRMQDPEYRRFVSRRPDIAQSEAGRQRDR